MSQVCGRDAATGDREFWRLLSARIAGQRIPFSGSLALTHRCNLSCVHCYAREGSGKSGRPAELSTEQWLRILAEIKEAGCLFLLLTGGEPLLREDFPRLYSFARRNGFLVTVFTNGTRVDQGIVDLFRELPPRLVEVSLYGAGAETHDRVTGVRGSFANAMRGIEALRGAGVTVRLKSVLMTLNEREFPAIGELAREMGLKFRFDPAIFPRLEGDKEPLNLRVAAEKAVELELADADALQEWRVFYEAFGRQPQGESLYECGTGVNTFHVDPQGRLFPCLMARNVSHGLAGGSFLDSWQEGFPSLRQASLDANSPCRGCRERLLCGYCPGFFEMENGTEREPSPYMCAIGRSRFARVVSQAHGG